MSLKLTFHFDLYYMSSISRSDLSHVGVAPRQPGPLAVDYVDFFDLSGIVLQHSEWNHMIAVKHD